MSRIHYKSKKSFHEFAVAFHRDGNTLYHAKRENELPFTDMCEMLYDDGIEIYIVPRVLFAFLVGDTLYYKYYREFTEIRNMTV